MEYFVHIIVVFCFAAILTTSYNLLIGFAGIFSFAHAALYAIGAYTTAILTTTMGLPSPIPLIASVAMAASLSAVIALPALRVTGHYIVIVTIALHVIVLQVILNWKSLTGGTDGISGVPALEIAGFAFDTPSRFLPVAIIGFLACYWFARRLVRSPFGRALRAMRENESAAQAVGLNILYMKVSVFAISAGLAAVAGSLFARYFSYVGVDSFTLNETIYILAMVILGGTGNLFGSVVGCAILIIMPEALKFLPLPIDIADKIRLAIYGLVMITVLMLRPQGLFPERRGRRAMLVDLDAEAEKGETDSLLAGNADKPPQTVLRGEALRKQFGGVVAVSDFSIEIETHRVTGLIGPNGAGKTTAFNMLTGFLRPTGGEITLRGRSIGGKKPHELVKAGVARSFQDLRLFTNMTVIENVIVALPGQDGLRISNLYLRPGQVRQQEHDNTARAMEILRFVELDGKAHETAADLSYAEEKLLVVARLLATGAEVLLFDEPMSGLDQTTLSEILPVLRRLAEQGKAVCIIEHNLDVINEVCDVVYYLDDGTTMAVGAPDDLMADPELAQRYFK